MCSSYDSWLLKRAEESITGCEPKIVKAEKEFEGTNEDGQKEYSMSYTYNCEECNEIDCEHWKDFHED